LEEMGLKGLRKASMFGDGVVGLIKQNLVEATLVGKISIYHITEKGIAVLETVSKLENTLQIS